MSPPSAVAQEPGRDEDILEAGSGGFASRGGRRRNQIVRFPLNLSGGDFHLVLAVAFDGEAGDAALSRSNLKLHPGAGVC